MHSAFVGRVTTLVRRKSSSAGAASEGCGHALHRGEQLRVRRLHLRRDQAGHNEIDPQALHRLVQQDL